MIICYNSLRKIVTTNQSLNKEGEKYMNKQTKRERRLSEFQRALELVKEIIENKEMLKIKYDKKIQDDIEDIEKLVTKILEYVFTEDLNLESNEVDIKYTKEYIYILTEIEIEKAGLYPSQIFADSLDLITCICRSASINEKQELVHCIMHYDYIPKKYDYYFSQTYKRTFA